MLAAAPLDPHADGGAVPLGSGSGVAADTLDGMAALALGELLRMRERLRAVREILAEPPGSAAVTGTPFDGRKLHSTKPS
jgi:hypothetical protein